MTLTYVPSVLTQDFGIDGDINGDIDAAGALTLDILDPYSPHCPADLPCQVGEADLWFADTPAQLEQAKAFCGDCPVRTACLAGAVERREPWGVWGGEIFERGVILARKRGRGRPRKSEVAASVASSTRPDSDGDMTTAA